MSLRRGAGHLHAIFHAISSWSIFFATIENFNFAWIWSDHGKNQVLFCQVQNHDLKSFSEFVLLVKTYKWTANVLIQNWFCELIWECKDSALNCPGTRVRGASIDWNYTVELILKVEENSLMGQAWSFQRNFGSNIVFTWANKKNFNCPANENSWFAYGFRLLDQKYAFLQMMQIWGNNSIFFCFCIYWSSNLTRPNSDKKRQQNKV